MKTTLIIISTSLMVFTAVAARNTNTVTEKPVLQKFALEQDCQEKNVDFVETMHGRTTGAPVEDQSIVNPESVFHVRFQPDVLEIIGQDQKITEGAMDQSFFGTLSELSIEDIIAANAKVIDEQVDLEVRPIVLERTIEDIIAEDHTIIESNFDNEEKPLYINGNLIAKPLKKDNFLF